MVSMALHNYIRRKLQKNITFIEFDYYPNFIPKIFLTDVVPHSQNPWKPEGFAHKLCS
jgi:hypothetical protein